MALLARTILKSAPEPNHTAKFFIDSLDNKLLFLLLFTHGFQLLTHGIQLLLTLYRDSRALHQLRYLFHLRSIFSQLLVRGSTSGVCLSIHHSSM